MCTMAFEHCHEALAIDWIADLDDDIKDESAAPRHQVEFVAILNLARTLDDDVGVRFEQAHTLVVRGTYSPPNT